MGGVSIAITLYICILSVNIRQHRFSFQLLSCYYGFLYLRCMHGIGLYIVRGMVNTRWNCVSSGDGFFFITIKGTHGCRLFEYSKLITGKIRELVKPHIS